jgi:TEA/ATTS domain
MRNHYIANYLKQTAGIERTTTQIARRLQRVKSQCSSLQRERNCMNRAVYLVLMLESSSEAFARDG